MAHDRPCRRAGRCRARITRPVRALRPADRSVRLAAGVRRASARRAGDPPSGRGSRLGRYAMRISDTEFTSRPWRIHDATPAFRLYAVWALPAVGRPDDLPPWGA